MMSEPNPKKKKGQGAGGQEEVYQSDLKEQGDRESERDQAILIAENVLSAIAAEPELCRHPRMQGILRMCRQIGNNTDKYPLSPGSQCSPCRRFFPRADQR